LLEGTATGIVDTLIVVGITEVVNEGAEVGLLDMETIDEGTEGRCDAENTFFAVSKVPVGAIVDFDVGMTEERLNAVVLLAFTTKFEAVLALKEEVEVVVLATSAFAAVLVPMSICSARVAFITAFP